jgi:hypothetical protein
MNAEELLIHIKEFVEGLEEFEDSKIMVVPTKYDPTKLQDDVTFFVMNKTGEGLFPKFAINVKDIEALRLKNQ